MFCQSSHPSRHYLPLAGDRMIRSRLVAHTRRGNSYATPEGENFMTARARRVLAAAVGATFVGVGTLVPTTARGEAVDFTTFTTSQGIPTSFVDPQWSTPDSYNGISVPVGRVARETTNADTTMFVGPSSLDVMNKIITGDLYAGNDDDYIGIAIGVPTANGNPMFDATADFLLLQWKGLSQSFDYIDRLAPGDAGYSPFQDRKSVV